MDTRTRRIATIFSWAFSGSMAIEVALVCLTRLLRLNGRFHRYSESTWGRRVQWTLRALAFAGIFVLPVALITGAVLTRRVFGAGLPPAIAGGLLTATAVAW